MLHLFGNQMKDFDAIDDFKGERVARRNYDRLVVLPRAPWG
jgi:hypothetical protein